MSKVIERFRFWVQQTMPIAYDDSLSFYELLNKVVVRLNEVVEQVNLTTELTVSELEELHKTINAFKEAIENEVMPENIGNILNEWMDNGKLATIINNEVFTAIHKEIYDVNLNLGCKIYENAVKIAENKTSVDAKLAHTMSNIDSRGISVLFPPIPLLGAKGDDSTDDIKAINNIINFVANNGGGKVHFPFANFRISSPILLDEDKVKLESDKATIRTTSNFDVSLHKGIIESLVRKNGVDRSNGSIEESAILGFHIDGEGKRIIGIALSGFTRGCECKYNFVENCYHGITASGCWSADILTNLSINNRMGGLVLGSPIDIVVNTVNMTHVDNGEDKTIKLEGYKYDGVNISYHCNAMNVVNNTLRGNKNNLMVNWGNANSFINNTLETPTNANLIMTASESCIYTANYHEANSAIVFGRNANGIVKNGDMKGNFFNGENFFFLGFAENEFINNGIIGDYKVFHGTMQRVYGNVTQLPNGEWNADSSPLKPHYAFIRDDTVSDDVVIHGGRLTSALQNSKLITGFKFGDYTTTTELLSKGDKNHRNSYSYVENVASTTATITPNNLSNNLIYITGQANDDNTVRFSDMVMMIGYGSATTVASTARNSPGARTYTVNQNSLQLSVAGGRSYKIRTTILGD